MFKENKSMEYGIIGLGRFGFALAKTLIEAEKKFYYISIDSDESKIKQIRQYTSNAFVVEILNKKH